MTLRNNWFKYPVNDNRMFIKETRARDRVIFLDLATDRELVLIDGYAVSARTVNHKRAERTFNFALEGKEGYEFQTVTQEEYEAFSELWNTLFLNSK